MPKIHFFYLLILFFVISSCKGEEECKTCNIKKEDVVKKDTVPSLENALKKEEHVSETKEKKENHQKIVQKYGEQWDFCTCVKINDSINKAFIKNPSDKQVEKLMDRSEYVDLKCKEFLTNPNTTPEERAIHEKKVKKCLRSK